MISSLSLEESTTKTTELAEMYESDLPSKDCMESELHCWWMKWQQELHDHGPESLPTTPTNALRYATTMFPNIRALISIMCTLPVTSCLAERSFSAVKRLKTAQRSSMGTGRLTGLTLLHIHRDIPVHTDDIIDNFGRVHPRKLEMVNILVD